MGEILTYENTGALFGMYQQGSAPADLNPKYCTVLRNMKLVRGVPRLRSGLRKLNGGMFGAANNNTMYGMTTWRDFTSGDKLIVASGAKLQSMPIVGGDPTDIATAYPSGFAARTGDRTQFVRFNGVLFIVNGVDNNVKYNGTNLTRMGLIAPVTLAAPSKSAGNLTGSYDYKATLVSSANNGSAESEPTTVAAVSYSSQQGTFSAPSVPSSDPQVDRWNLYRKPQAGTLYYRVNTTPQTLASTIADNIDDLVLQAGTKLDDLLVNSVPPGAFTTLCEHQGRLVGAIGNTLYWSDQGLGIGGLFFKPESWPPANTMSFASTGGTAITAVVSFFTSLVVFQDFGVWEIANTLADETDREIFPLMVAPDSHGIGTSDITNIGVTENRVVFAAKDQMYQIVQNPNALRSTLRVTPLVDSITALYTQIDFGRGGVSIYDRDNKQWLFWGKGQNN